MEPKKIAEEFDDFEILYKNIIFDDNGELFDEEKEMVQ